MTLLSSNPDDRWRRRGAAVLASCLLHGVVLAVLAKIALTGREPAWRHVIASAWDNATVAEELDPADVTAPALFVNPDAGGSGSDPTSELMLADVFDSGDIPSLASTFDPSLPLFPASSSVVAKRSRPTKGQHSTGGSGTGTGTGVGPGSGPGFFGLTPPDTTRVVFVVDNSRSMNHPHESELKTRFRRVKFELLKCISEMKAGQSFYVVFFSDETLPMPARTLQSAEPGYRDPYLRWIGQVESGGSPTDPRNALKLALQLEPDLICFLTDGEFPKGVNRQLQTLKQDRIAIHTFAFGDTLGEETLKTIAANNRGEYRFVP